MKKIKLSENTEQAYHDLDNAFGIVSLVQNAINQNNGGLYDSKSKASFEVKFAYMMLKEVCQLLTPCYEKESLPKELFEDISTRVSFIIDKFEYDITQTALVNEEQHKTEFDASISSSLFGACALLRQANSNFELDEIDIVEAA